MSSSDSARMEVVQCERDIQSIKAALRQVSSADENKPNSLQVVWTKLEGLDADDTMEVSLQLSSPVEEAILKKMWTGGDEEQEEGSSMVVFSGVESSMATLAVTLKKGGQLLGTSEAFDMAPVCSLLGDAMSPKEAYVTELPVAIMSPVGEETPKPSDDTVVVVDVDAPPTDTATTVEEEEKASGEADVKKEETTQEDNKEEEKEDTKSTTESTMDTTEETPTVTVLKPVCNLTLQMTFKPSAKDQKEELYELLNKASLRRSQALERHREEQSAVLALKSPTKKPTVKPGFLNKKDKKPEKQESKIMQFYHTYLGPNSFGRAFLFPIAKNYIIFFGAVILFHFKGQELALPAPV